MTSDERRVLGALRRVMMAAVALAAMPAAAWAGPPANLSPPMIVSESLDTNHVFTWFSDVGSQWSDDTTSLAVQWEDCDVLGLTCFPIPDADERSFLLQPADAGHRVRVVETGYNASGPSAPAASAMSAVIQPYPTLPGLLTAPAIKGRRAVGSKLRVSHGRWTGTKPITFTYQWARCRKTVCVTIGDATTSRHRVTAADVGHAMHVSVGAINPVGTSGAGSNFFYASPNAYQPPSVAPSVIQNRLLWALGLSPENSSAARLRRRGGWTSRFDALVPGRLTVTWTALAHPVVVVASGSRTLRGTGPLTLTAAFTKAGRPLFQQDMVITRTGTFKPAGSAHAVTVSVSTRLTR